MQVLVPVQASDQVCSRTQEPCASTSVLRALDKLSIKPLCMTETLLFESYKNQEAVAASPSLPQHLVQT